MPSKTGTPTSKFEIWIAEYYMHEKTMFLLSFQAKNLAISNFGVDVQVS